jgi:formate dehydrogenase subunit gamma
LHRCTSKIDWEWLKRGGGFLSDKSPNPPARRFNAGQKLIFWAVMLGGGLLILSGLSLMLPFFWLDIQGMQWVQIVHAALGLIMIAVIIGHIYIGTVSMQGAFDAMWSGRGRPQLGQGAHSLWVKELDKDGRAAERGGGPWRRRQPEAVPGE